jgi:ribose transport system ATP-binding protein
MQLLLAPAVVLVLVALSQMFVVGGSEVDLGVGNFVSMVNVLSATFLVTAPALGAAMLAAGLAGYALLAVLIRTRSIPAIVATLGASFVWSGIGRTIQPSPGGSAPDWLRATFDWQIPGLPAPVALILAAGAVALMIDRSPLGVVLRGFGSSPEALARLGWPPIRYSIWRYLIAGAFAMAAGLYLTALNGASDIRVGGSYTLLSIAGAVLGGCALLGGLIAPAGVVAGAVTLALIGAALAMLGVGTDYNALVQGSLLLAILGLRTILGGRQADAD